MKLSTLHEDRDPKKEAELEPILTAPFRKVKERKKLKAQELKKGLETHGIPDRQFVLPISKKPLPRFVDYKTYETDRENPDYKAPIKPDDYTTPYLSPTELKYGDIRTPSAHVPIYHQPSQNVAQPGGQHLQNAISYWSKNFEGKRWPTLEQAFINRDWTFQGGKGMYNTARVSLFKYLNNLKEPWPEGEEMANRVISGPKAVTYLTEYPEILKYALSKPINPSIQNAIKQEIERWDGPYRDWLAAQEKPKELTFHDDDEFFRPNKPASFNDIYGSKADMLRKYVSS